MRLIASAFLTIAVLATFPAEVQGQAILNYGLAAGAGSVAGTAAGKQVSNSLDVILGKTNKTLDKAAQQGQALDTTGLTEQQILELKQQQHREAEKLRTDREAAAREFGRKATAARTGAQPRWTLAALPPPAMLSPLWNIKVENIVQTPAALPAVTAEGLSSIAAGASREDVLGNFGTPSARVVIPDGNRINEVYYYQSGSDTVGTVRMSQGSVTGVIVNAN